MVTRRPIFIVGSPRTGTTLMKDVLNGHSQVHVFNEVHFFERIWDQRDALGDLSLAEDMTRAIEDLRDVVLRRGSDPEAAEALPTEAFRSAALACGGGYAGLLRALLQKGADLHGAPHWGDSSPQDVLYLDTLFAWYPDARVIGMVRDPRAFLGSYKNYHRRANAAYRERYNPLSNSLLWRSYMNALLAASRGAHAASVRITSYERVVADPEREIREVCSHLGIAFEPTMLQVSGANSSYERGTGRPGIHSQSLDRWREELTPTEIWLVERICGGEMASLGYERAAPGARPSARELLGILALVPLRLFNMMFRGSKAFHWRKLKKVVASLNPKSSAPTDR